MESFSGMKRKVKLAYKRSRKSRDERQKYMKGLQLKPKTFKSKKQRKEG